MAMKGGRETHTNSRKFGIFPKHTASNVLSILTAGESRFSRPSRDSKASYSRYQVPATTTLEVCLIRSKSVTVNFSNLVRSDSEPAMVPGRRK